jgi:DNA topoisomerase-1
MKNLVIVESPTKSKKIEEFLGADYIVLSSNGHIRDLSKKEMSIDIDNQYEPEYQITEDKHKLVSDLKKAVKEAETVWLASDEDREGEAIAWHLQETLKLDPAKTKRIVFNEITKNAILNAIQNPRGIDMNLVDAQQARRVLDRIVGYEISPILWSKIKPALSAGRVQSVAVRLIVEREEEIKNFVSQSFFRVTSQFLSSNGRMQVHAELGRRFDQQDQAREFMNSLIGCSFKVETIETKPAKRTPAPPFTTSTLQQEASRKLGFSVARTMQIAQQLYENGFITYMRTDSVNLSEVALEMTREEVNYMYGDNYVKTRRFQTKTKGAQEAHEAIRPTDMSMHVITAETPQRRLYELIWKRTIASQMADAEIEKTVVDISITDNHGPKEDKFVCQGEQVRFDGFLKVYMESTDDEDTNEPESTHTLPKLVEGMPLSLVVAQAAEHHTQHPPRYTEASLVKKLEELGIGRPSTYAPTISTILKREYVIKEDREAQPVECTVMVLKDGKVETEQRTEKMGSEKGKLFPTDIGSVVNKFLIEHFANIMDYNFTATVERDFDDIAAGKKEWRKVIDKFYVPFHKNIKQTQQNSQRTSGERLVGVDPKTGKNLYAKIGRYGTLVQLGDTSSEEKPKFASMKKGQSIETITLEEALALFQLPRTVGQFENEDVIVSIGKYGPYVRHKGQFYSLSKNDDPYEITIERCIEIIKIKRQIEDDKIRIQSQFPRELGLFDGDMVFSNIGRYGPYLTHKNKNYKIPKEIDPVTISIEEAQEIILNSSPKKPRGRKKKAE